MCHQQPTVKKYIYIHVHLKFHYMQAEVVKEELRVRTVYSRCATERIYLTHMKKKNVNRNKYGILAWEDRLRCCL